MYKRMSYKYINVNPTNWNPMWTCVVFNSSMMKRLPSPNQQWALYWINIKLPGTDISHRDLGSSNTVPLLSYVQTQSRPLSSFLNSTEPSLRAWFVIKSQVSRWCEIIRCLRSILIMRNKKSLLPSSRGESPQNVTLLTVDDRKIINFPIPKTAWVGF